MQLNQEIKLEDNNYCDDCPLLIYLRAGYNGCAIYDDRQIDVMYDHDIKHWIRPHICKKENRP